MSALTPAAVPPYFFTYSATIFTLAGFFEPPYHEFGTIMPSALPAPTALMNAAPWSGPAVATNASGV